MLLRRIGRAALAVLAAGALAVLLAGSLAVPASRSAAALLQPGDRAGLGKHRKDPPPPAVQALDPALFSPGACLAFAPTSGNRHETVFLDAGHGGIDPGAVGNTESGATIEESTINLPIELDTMALLRAQGYRVVVSRTQNTTVTRLTAGDTDGELLTAQGVFNDVTARDVCANLARATVLVGIYMDAGYWGEAGCLTGYDADRPFSADNLRLATLLQDDVLGAMNAQGWAIPDAGVQQDTGLGSAVGAAAENYDHLLLLGPAQAGYFSTPSQMPGALIEPLFLTDPFEGSIAASAQGQHVISGAIAQAVAAYLTDQG
jgi:N-acetylmuramoyl-L-alanine amidase